MKKSLLLTILFLLLTIPLTMVAAEKSVDVGQLRYTVDTDANTAEVQGPILANEKIHNLVIPDFIDYNGNQIPVTSIRIYAFENCSGFTGSLTIGDNVTTIGNGAFEGCSGFSESLTIGNSVKTIGKNAFRNCTGLTGSLIIGNSVTTIEDSAFRGCIGFTGSLTIGDSVTTIGDYAFWYCTGFTGTLTIGNSVTSIGKCAFQACSGFTGSLTIGDSVTTIEDHAFTDCSGLTGSLIIGDSVLSIGDYAFQGCSGFNGSLTIGNSVTTIGKYTFQGCSGFTGSLTIGDSVTTIGSGAFYNCSGFNGSLTIGDSVTTIEDHAFTNCSGFTGSLTIGDSVTTIGVYAFGYCSGFTGPLTIGDSVTLIENGAFSSCSNISSLDIKSTDLKINYFAFYGMDALQSITCYASTPPECIYSGGYNCIFSRSTYTRPLNVPSEAIEKYKTATEWEKFTNIKPISDPATSISLNKSELDLKVGESETLIASLLPENVTETVTWSVVAEPEGCVTVEDGNVTAVAPGSATVTATAGEFSASCKVTVTQPASEIVIDFAASGIEGEDLTLNVGETKTIAVTVTPANSTDKLTWSSSNAEIATVDSEGKITAVKAGEATVTVTTESGKSTSLKVTVLQPASEIVIDFAASGIEGEDLTLNVGETKTIAVTVTPANSTDKLTWSSSNAEIATVDSEGKITAVKAGEATVTVTTESGKSASLKVTVLQPVEDIVIDFNGMGISGDKLEMHVGDSKEIVVTVNPEDASDKSLTFVSADTEVATVNEDGVITAVALGNTTITITAGNGVSATLKVTVTEDSGVSGIYDNGLRVSVNGSVIKVTGAGNSIVRIMAADGKPVFTAQGDCHANVVPGFYLVVVGDNVTKVVAKY